MLRLFPSIRRKTWIILVGFNALCIANFFINPSTWVLTVALMVLGSLALFVMEMLNASKAHTQLTELLYDKLNPEAFLKGYEGFLQVPVKKESLRVLIRLHIANAYVALGRFSDCRELLTSLLSSLSANQKEEELLTVQMAIHSTLCLNAAEEGNIAEAESELASTQSVQKRLEKIQETKPEKKRMAYNNILQEQCVAYLKTGKMDTELVKNKVQAYNSQMLHRITTGLWIAKGDLAAGQKQNAVDALKQIVQLAPTLYPGKEAQRMLDEM